MKKIKKPVFVITALLILGFSALTTVGFRTYYGDYSTTWIKGVGDIRWGIDIRGGVDVTFVPDVADFSSVTSDNVDAAKTVIETRMISKNITDYEVYADYNTGRVIVRFPWQSGDSSFNPEEAVKELGETAMLTFREGMISEEKPNYEDLPIVISGIDVDRAAANYDSQTREYMVSLSLNPSGSDKFAEATGRLAGRDVISIWLDDVYVSSPRVNEQISGGRASITGEFTLDEAKSLANKINGGALPYKLKIDSFSTITPTLGMGARDAMALAGVIAFALIAVFMTSLYRLPGVIAVFGLLGQAFGSLAVISGFFGFNESFTLTIPGIAGIVLSLGMGIDANVITGERIKEELRMGKSLDGALVSGYKRAFTAIFDGNITVLMIAFILMGAFGTPDSWASMALSPVFFMFGPSTAGTIYSFGYTLIVGVILNFVFGVFASRIMIYSISKFKAFRKPHLYGGYKDGEEKPKEEKKPFDAVKNKAPFIITPAVIVLAAFVVLMASGLEVAIEFKGGSILTYAYEGEIDAAKVKSAVEETGKGSVKVTTGSSFGSGAENITIAFTSNEAVTTDTLDELERILAGKFDNLDTSPLTSQKQNVSPAMGKTFFLKCLVAVVFSFIVLVLYIALRFKKIGGWSAGACAIIALLHDVLLVFAAVIFFRLSVDANFMAVVLTVLGYSINSTIVIYDRIRENRALLGNRASYRELVNKSVSQSFTRSLNTTITTVFTLGSICAVAVIAGINSIISFAFPMTVGMIAGFFSSLFISAPLWVVWQEYRRKNAKSKSRAEVAGRG
ncbi:MAG: protein translocase subunit SecF [Oscillospiraceae bacterium]|nr:protein translocase subunit SecF [Oscillospiraceae bacterium]